MTKLDTGIPAPQLKQEAKAPTRAWMGLLGLWAESGIGGSGEAWPTVQKDLLAGMASGLSSAKSAGWSCKYSQCRWFNYGKISRACLIFTYYYLSSIRRLDSPCLFLLHVIFPLMRTNFFLLSNLLNICASEGYLKLHQEEFVHCICCW